MERFDQPDKFLHDAWHLLIKAAAKRKGDYQKPIIATIDADGFAQQRVVVLRDVDLQQRMLTLFTDARSEKVKALQDTPLLSWLFWDERKKVQIRMIGRVVLEQGSDRCQKLWDRLPVQGRTSYATVSAPGTPQEKDTVPLPDYWHADMDLEQTASAFEHFMVVTCQVFKVDLLHLHHEGHQRAQFEYQDGSWQGHWVTP
ncbi:MAG: pyridoxamine 5'-phosphate oxidase family protein [Phaeodactylibacter sp.]|uniref:pyridoxamine 5'-phosphate oxidase family protein n=1 Tax=Phaeodactylibacter sp. TaxID=1940289 RepID=UPI0032F0860F